MIHVRDNSHILGTVWLVLTLYLWVFVPMSILFVLLPVLFLILEHQAEREVLEDWGLA